MNADLKQAIEAAVCAECGFPRRGLKFTVDSVDVRKQRPLRFQAKATLHFLPKGSPFCCSESGCHLGAGGEFIEKINRRVQAALGWKQPIHVEFINGIASEVHLGAMFKIDAVFRKPADTRP